MCGWAVAPQKKTYKIFNTTLKTTVLIFCAAHEHLCAGVESAILTLLYASVFQTRHSEAAFSCSAAHTEKADNRKEVSAKCEYFKSRLKTHLILFFFYILHISSFFLFSLITAPFIHFELSSFPLHLVFEFSALSVFF